MKPSISGLALARGLILASLIGFTAPAHATLHWIGTANGGDGVSTYQEANWDNDGDPAAPHTAPPAGTVDPNVAINDALIVHIHRQIRRSCRNDLHADFAGSSIELEKRKVGPCCKQWLSRLTPTP